MFCESCGQALSGEAQFCVKCGKPVTKAAAPPETPAVSKLIEPGEGVWSNAPAPADAVAPTVAPPPPVTVAAPVFAPAYAGFWRRVVAYLIDAFLFFFVQFAFAKLRGVAFAERDVDMMHAARQNVAGVIVGWLYFALLESSVWQATIGKRAMDIYVTDLKGARISFARATGRYFAKMISIVILLIGIIMIAFTEKKQGLHDMLADCLVVRRK